MMAGDETMLRTLRGMAWRRVKGELEAMTETFWSDQDRWPGQFEKLDAAIQKFVKEVEDEGLHE